MAKPRKKGGRTTPKGTAAARSASGPAPKEDRPLGQVGRRPTSPPLLLAIAVMWIFVGVIALTRLSASWKIVPGIVFIGIGVLYLRAAGTAYLRQTGRSS